jgi:hypothetical protein
MTEPVPERAKRTCGVAVSRACVTLNQSGSGPLFGFAKTLAACEGSGLEAVHSSGESAAHGIARRARSLALLRLLEGRSPGSSSPPDSIRGSRQPAALCRALNCRM